MTQKRSRWIINVVLVVAIVAFVGVSTLPWLFSGASSENPSAQVTPTPTQTVNPSQRDDLEALARGYEVVLQREPENQTALRGLLEVRLELVDIKGTIPPLEKLTQLHPEETNYAVLLAQAKQYTGDYEGAALTYRQVLTSRPGNLDALQGLVNLLQEQKGPEAAIGLLQETLKTATQANQIEPETVDTTAVKLMLGRVYASDRRYEEAIAIYDETIADSNDDFRPLLGKAMVLKTQGNMTEAKPLFDTAASLAPARYKDQINQLAREETAVETETSPAEE